MNNNKNNIEKIIQLVGYLLPPKLCFKIENVNCEFSLFENNLSEYYLFIPKSILRFEKLTDEMYKQIIKNGRLEEKLGKECNMNPKNPAFEFAQEINKKNSQR